MHMGMEPLSMPLTEGLSNHCTNAMQKTLSFSFGKARDIIPKKSEQRSETEQLSGSSGPAHK